MTVDWSAVPWDAVATATVGVLTLVATIALWRLDRRRARRGKLTTAAQPVDVAPVTVGRVEGAVALRGEVENSAKAGDGGVAAAGGRDARAVRADTYIEQQQVMQPASPVRPTMGLPLEAVPAGFVDRAELTGPVEALLTGQGSPAVLLHGMAGAGKTLLARRVAERVAARFGGGVLQLRLGGEQQPTLTAGDALGRLLVALDVDAENIPEALADRAALYRSQLAGRDVLVVLDNAVDAEQVAPLLPRLAGCAAVVTSRDTLAGLGGAVERVAVEELTVAQGVALLERRLGGARVAGEHEDAVRLVELCGRLALAVALAAGPLTTRQRRPLAAVVAALADEGARLDPVRASFRLSYETLDGDQGRMFRLLGLLDVADVDVELAAVLADLAVERASGLLEGLVDRSLVQPANVQSGVRTGAWSIVSADPAATVKLEENQRADYLGDAGYDSARTSRQGSDVLAEEAATQEQRC